jgi:hypothetical protein
VAPKAPTNPQQAPREPPYLGLEAPSDGFRVKNRGSTHEPGADVEFCEVGEPRALSQLDLRADFHHAVRWLPETKCSAERCARGTRTAFSRQIAIAGRLVAISVSRPRKKVVWSSAQSGELLD